jgi:hypothetical protein
LCSGLQSSSSSDCSACCIPPFISQTSHSRIAVTRFGRVRPRLPTATVFSGPASFQWRLAGLPCYSFDMQVVARSLTLLLLAVALMLPTVARTSAYTEAPIAAQAEPVAAGAFSLFLQSATSYQAGPMAMRCHRCFGMACGGSAVACGGCCGTASAIAPFVIVLASVSGPSATPPAFKAVRDHGLPPDPHPPKAIIVC